MQRLKHALSLCGRTCSQRPGAHSSPPGRKPGVEIRPTWPYFGLLQVLPLVVGQPSDLLPNTTDPGHDSR